MNEVATKSTELVTLALNANSTAEAYVEMPVSVGNKQYWLKIENDSEKAWLNGGLGETISGSADLQVCLPREASAVGYYIGGRGAAVLSCDMNDGTPQVTLSCSGG